jgi:hypothetical protein
MNALPLPFPVEPSGSDAGADYTAVLDRLAESSFRRRKRLLGTELEQLRAKGIEEIGTQAMRLVRERLGSAQPTNDGRQTPYRGHPVFIAQHATATCCRSCLEIWHRVPKGRPLSEPECEYVAGLIEAWLRREIGLESVTLDADRAASRGAARPGPALRRSPPGRKRRRSEVLRLVIEGDGEDGVAPTLTPDLLLLEEREADGTLLRRWLQLELFSPRAERAIRD